MHFAANGLIYSDDFGLVSRRWWHCVKR